MPYQRRDFKRADGKSWQKLTDIPDPPSSSEDEVSKPPPNFIPRGPQPVCNADFEHDFGSGPEGSGEDYNAEDAVYASADEDGGSVVGSIPNFGGNTGIPAFVVNDREDEPGPSNHSHDSKSGSKSKKKSSKKHSKTHPTYSDDYEIPDNVATADYEYENADSDTFADGEDTYKESYLQDSGAQDSHSQPLHSYPIPEYRNEREGIYVKRTGVPEHARDRGWIKSLMPGGRKDKAKATTTTSADEAGGKKKKVKEPTPPEVLKTLGGREPSSFRKSRKDKGRVYHQFVTKPRYKLDSDGNKVIDPELSRKLMVDKVDVKTGEVTRRKVKNQKKIPGLIHVFAGTRSLTGKPLPSLKRENLEETKAREQEESENAMLVEREAWAEREKARIDGVVEKEREKVRVKKEKEKEKEGRARRR